jgi:hypothetical protein
MDLFGALKMDAWVNTHGQGLATLLDIWLRILCLLFTLMCMFNLTQAIEDIAKSLNDIRVCVRDRNLNLCEVFKELKQHGSYSPTREPRDSVRKRRPSTPTASSVSAADPL